MRLLNFWIHGCDLYWTGMYLKRNSSKNLQMSTKWYSSSTNPSPHMSQTRSSIFNFLLLPVSIFKTWQEHLNLERKHLWFTFSTTETYFSRLSWLLNWLKNKVYKRINISTPLLLSHIKHSLFKNIIYHSVRLENMDQKYERIPIFSLFLKNPWGYLKSHWTNTRLVCTKASELVPCSLLPHWNSMRFSRPFHSPTRPHCRK